MLTTADHFGSFHRRCGLSRYSSERAFHHYRESPNRVDVVDSDDLLTVNIQVRKNGREKSIN